MTIEERIAKHVCCFCEGKLENTIGNNPDPACTAAEARCCDYCDSHIVWPARLFIKDAIEKALKQKA